MRNFYLKIVFAMLIIAVLGNANEAVEQVEPKTTESKSKFIQYHNRIVVFAPFHQGYERIKPNAFYAGVEGYWVPVLNKSENNTLLDVELRMGYSFFLNGKDHLIPIAGVGYVKDFFRHDHHTRHNPGVIYAAIGFLYDHEFNTILNLGVNTKFLIGGPESEKRFDWGSPIVGSDVSLPITFRFGHKRHWDFRLEPFNMSLHGSKETENYFGFRSTIGYRF